MENLNLFGIPMGDDEGEGAKNLGETQKILQELVSAMSQLDSQDISNFSLRKSFVYYDVIPGSLKSLIAL